MKDVSYVGSFYKSKVIFGYEEFVLSGANSINQRMMIKNVNLRLICVYCAFGATLVDNFSCPSKFSFYVGS